jgi:hypothetical protein
VTLTLTMTLTRTLTLTLTLTMTVTVTLTVNVTMTLTLTMTMTLTLTLTMTLTLTLTMTVTYRVKMVVSSFLSFRCFLAALFRRNAYLRCRLSGREENSSWIITQAAARGCISQRTLWPHCHPGCGLLVSGSSTCRLARTRRRHAAGPSWPSPP